MELRRKPIDIHKMRECSKNKPFWFRLYRLSFHTTDLVRLGDYIECPLCYGRYTIGSGFTTHFRRIHPGEKIGPVLKKIKDDKKHFLTARPAPKLNERILRISGKKYDLEVIIISDEQLNRFLSCNEWSEIFTLIDISDREYARTSVEIEQKIKQKYDTYLGKKDEKPHRRAKLLEPKQPLITVKEREIFNLGGQTIEDYQYEIVLRNLPENAETAMTTEELRGRVKYSRMHFYHILKILRRANVLNYYRKQNRGGTYLYWQKEIPLNKALSLAHKTEVQMRREKNEI